MKFIWNQAYFLMIITALAWSGNAITAKGLNDIIPPVGLVFWRWMVAIPILVIIAWPNLKYDLRKIRENWKILIVLSFFSITAYNTLLYQGLLYTTAINSFLINASRPMFIVLLSIIFFRNGINLTQSFGFLLASMGTVNIIVEGQVGKLLALDFNIGDLWILGGTICLAIHTVFLRKSPSMHPASFLAITVTIGAIILLPFYIWEIIYVAPTPFKLETVGGVLYLAIFASIVAYLCYNRAVEIAGPNKAGQVSYILPISGTVLAILLLDERIELFHIIGLPLILAGIYFGSKDK